MTKGSICNYLGMIEVLTNNQVSPNTIIDSLYDLNVYDELESMSFLDLLIWVDKSFNDMEARFDAVSSILRVLPAIEDN